MCLCSNTFLFMISVHLRGRSNKIEMFFLYTTLYIDRATMAMAKEQQISKAEYEYDAEQAARTEEEEEAQAEEAELARQLEIQEHIFSYPDGSVYMGHMRDSGDTGHKRHGRGTLRTPAFVYGQMKNYTSEEAADNAHLAKWHEYSGTWYNDKLHGHGVHVQKSGDGGEILIFEGIWEHGKPMRANIEYEYDSDGNLLDGSVFGW